MCKIILVYVIKKQFYFKIPDIRAQNHKHAFKIFKVQFLWKGHSPMAIFSTNRKPAASALQAQGVANCTIGE